MTDLLPRSRLIKVECFVALPCDATKAEIDEWACHHLGHGCMGALNPLSEFELESASPPVLTDEPPHMYLHEEVIREGEKIITRSYVRPVPFAGKSSLEQIERLIMEKRRP